MRKSTRIVKRALALFLIVLMSIENFAAVVSDNDGAAFITKAEFDSLKNNFQAQIDQYNTSIDSKIDGAIASYLAGINLTKVSILTNELKKAEEDSVNNVTFQYWNTPVATSDVPDVRAGFFLSANFGCGYHVQGTRTVHGYHIVSNVNAGGAFNWSYYPDGSTENPNYTSSYYWSKLPFAKFDDVGTVTAGNSDPWVLDNLARHRLKISLKTVSNSFGESPQNVVWPTGITHVTGNVVTDFSTRSETMNGPGVFDWTSTFNLVGYSARPESTISHIWSYNDLSGDEANNEFLKYQLSGTIPDTYTDTVVFDYRDVYSSLNQKNYTIETSTTSKGSTISVFNRQSDGSDISWYTVAGQPRINTGATFIWTWNQQIVRQQKWSNLTTQYWNNRFNIPFYKYYGIPICKTENKPGKLKFKLKITNSRTDGNTDPLKYIFRIMDRPFPNSGVPDSLIEDGVERVLYKKRVDPGVEVYETDIEIDKEKIWNTSDGDYIYIKPEHNTLYQRLKIEVVGDIKYEVES
ncbi:MAG: hypothetical protein J6P02_06085 [Lachnospiraceae bacterium]|nr:hypothetical protein [Lachnospiraceae bacterium]